MPKQSEASSLARSSTSSLKTIYNVSPYPQPLSTYELAVQPGDGIRLTAERANQLLTFPDWSEDNPRPVPSRPAKTQPEPDPEPAPESSSEPAESGDPQENPE